MAGVIRHLNLNYWPQPDPPFPSDRFTLGEANVLVSLFSLILVYVFEGTNKRFDLTRSTRLVLPFRGALGNS